MTPFFLHSATSRFFQHSSPISSFRLSSRPRSRLPFFFGAREEEDHVNDSMSTPIACTMYAYRTENDNRTVRVCGCFPDTRRATLRIPCAALPMLARPRTRTRVAKHTFASVEDEDDARKSVLKHPTLFVESPLYLKKVVKPSSRSTWCPLI